MKNPGMFIIALRTMLNSRGGDTPPEALWALTVFIQFLNKEYSLEIEEIGEWEYYNDNEKFHEVIQELEEKIAEL